MIPMLFLYDIRHLYFFWLNFPYKIVAFYYSNCNILQQLLTSLVGEIFLFASRKKSGSDGADLFIQSLGVEFFQIFLDPLLV